MVINRCFVSTSICLSNLNLNFMTTAKTIEEIYQKKSQLEHILLRPDTYIGSIEYDTQQLWVYNNQLKEIEFRMVKFVPGLYKIFGKLILSWSNTFLDEILVNAADNFQRDKTMNKINVDINQGAGTISVWNNGKGIPIEIHKEHNCYVAEMIFGKLLFLTFQGNC